MQYSMACSGIQPHQRDPSSMIPASAILAALYMHVNSDKGNCELVHGMWLSPECYEIQALQQIHVIPTNQPTTSTRLFNGINIHFSICKH